LAEPLKNYYDISVATNIAHMLLHVVPNFDSDGFVEHALRSAIKRGEKDALDALGYGARADVQIEHEAITPKNAKMGPAFTLVLHWLIKPV
jgi:hypothetical protein